MLLTLFYMLIGLVVLGVGAECLVNGASRLALRLGVTPLVIGLTVVAFGTSAPELAVSVESTLDGLSAIALGNVVGSNIANIGLILGITALIQPIRIERSVVRHQIPIVIVCSVVMGVMLIDGEVGMLDGCLLIAGLIAYLIFSYRDALGEVAEDEFDLPALVTPRQPGRIWINVLLVLAGLALLVTGSRVFVMNTVDLARLLGISEAIIALSLVAIGTSVPELATSVTAAMRGQADIAVGNVVGSNTFNILCVLGVTALFGTVSGLDFTLFDFGTMLLFAVVLLPFTYTGLVLNRFEGALLVLGYGAYLSILSQQAGA